MPSSITWQKSSFSGGAQGNDCVEIGISPTGLHLRESDSPDVVLTTTSAALGAFLRSIKANALAHHDVG
ncbi:DUF397 domain-containing protein [Streptomyces sp. H10-C2]|uniref:DUF397 domain-containing protein n=1 Tax=unclassified Streptomyces TaxID=2593676 RepID=UPI0024B9B4E5|nr:MULTISPECIES: DUF397 domain-containing protein [unclassified Streptomyces]MDJ0344350.1 DUF397 domain-containing protein [Streptomyces sp. PH10-H1]MDJ0373719.1 DUF397 domain-containing protein [Streptomyces sp. H10-C2]